MRARWAVLPCVLIAACGGSAAPEPATEAQSSDPGPIHVHGLGIDPADGALYVATHTGLFRAPAGQTTAARVAGRYQDTMGFTVVGPGRFLGSGHPDGREELPPFLGLIESRDRGETWSPLSLQGDVDFHVLEASGDRVYGFGSDFETSEPRFLASDDGGLAWERLEPPEPLMSLAISPADADELVGSGEGGVFRSADGGQSWRTVDAPSPGYLVWNESGVFLAAPDGRVWRASEPGGSWVEAATDTGGPVAAFDSGPGGELLVALHTGEVKVSADAGQSWQVRSAPG